MGAVEQVATALVYEVFLLLDNTDSNHHLPNLHSCGLASFHRKEDQAERQLFEE